jgi:hypothetical protein
MKAQRITNLMNHVVGYIFERGETNTINECYGPEKTVKTPKLSDYSEKILLETDNIDDINKKLQELGMKNDPNMSWSYKHLWPK